MPPHKPAFSLKTLGKDKVLYKVCEIIIEEIFFSSDENWEVFGPPSLSTRLQIARDIFTNSLSADLLQDILNTILEKDEDVEPTVRYVALQLLLVKGVVSLIVGHFPESYYDLVLQAISESCASIQRLDLKGLWIRETNKLAFCKVIRRLNEIRNLTLRYVCDDELLQIIGKHCRKLERLDISGSDKISEVGLVNFIENPSKSLDGFISDICASLQIIDLGGPGAQHLSPNLGAKLIRSLPHLKSLGSYEKACQSIEIIYKDNPNYKCDIRYLHDVGTNSQRLSAVAKMCPEIQAIYLDCPGSTAVRYLHMLKKMTEIKLRKVKWEDLKFLLENCGTKLRNIFLLTVWDPISLIELGSYCPNVVRLEMHFVSLICSETTHPTALQKIKELHIFNSRITTTCAKLIVNQCISIQVLSLGDCAQLTDAAIISSLMDYSLKQVQSIWFGLAENLTERTINALIDHCPMLTNLGNLAGWNVGSDDIELIRAQLLSLNLDLELHEYGQEEQFMIPFEPV